MLARQCGRHGRAPTLAFRSCSSLHFRCPLRAPLPVPNSPIWITEECLHRAFQSFFYRSISSSQPKCEYSSDDYSRKLLRRRMSMVRAEAFRHDRLEIVGVRKWDETPPTFSWSIEKRPGIGTSSDGSTPITSKFESLPPRPKGVHYYMGDTGSSTSNFLSTIFKPMRTFFPTSWNDPPPPPPPPLSISTPSSTAALESLEEGILNGIKSMGWVLTNYRALKRSAPYLQLSSRSMVSMFQRLLEMGRHWEFLEVLEKEDLVAVESVDLVWLSLDYFEGAKRNDVLEGLYSVCKSEGRQRFCAMLAEVEARAQEDLHAAILKETTQMMSQILKGKGATEADFARGVKMAKDTTMLCAIIDRILSTRTKIGIETSRAIFQRFIDLENPDESIKYALNSSINVPGTDNIANLCTILCNKTRYQTAYDLIIAALKVDKFGFLSDQDVLVGVRAVDSTSERTEEQLVDLWEALNKSSAISVRDITKNTFSAFIGRACRLKFGRKDQWWQGNGATPLFKMCIEIIILRLRGEVKLDHLATLLETWVWNWHGNERARVNLNSLDESIPFLPVFLDVLSPTQLDHVFTVTINRITANCLRKGGEIFPVRVLWPFVASVAQNSRIWTNEESTALWVLEGAILRKGLVSKYLAFRTDSEIARFVVRHYLPFRLALENPDGSAKEKAKRVFFQLTRDLEQTERDMDPETRAGLETGIVMGPQKGMGPFATAILAFQGTGIPCRTLLLDMVYTLLRLHRPQEIVHMLQHLNPYGIRPSSSQYARLIRIMTAAYPDAALRMLKLYAKSQYSTFASYIATVAYTHPHHALAAYRFLTRTNRFPFTLDQPTLVPRRYPKRRLLIAMAWKFANSPVLTARQCLRWVHKCYGTMMKLGYSPGPTMGLAFAVAGVQRTIREGIPVRVGSARMRWLLVKVRKQAGPKKAAEVEEILRRWEAKRTERARGRSWNW